MPATLLTASVEEAAAVLRRGGTVAFPTETVYGLGASALDAAAIGRVFQAKGRPADNPLIVHVAAREDLARVAHAVPPVAERLVDAFFPGPLTLVLPKHPDVPDEATAGLDTVGVRMPAHEQARALIAAAGVPLVAPSANRSGRPSPTTWEAVRADLDGRIDALLVGEPTAIGLESTVVDATGPVPLLLRAGAVTLEQLRAVVPETTVHAPTEGEPVRSPGLRHRHYAPRARVRVVSGPEAVPAAPDAGYIGLHAPPAGLALVEVCPDVEAYARRLFAFFRRCDAADLAAVYAEAVPEAGLGRALMDRLRRAAEP